MSDIPDIIDTPIVTSNWDAFWQAGALPQPVDVLVVSQPYEAGSKEETQLHKMLQACLLDLRQCHILHLTAEENIAWHQLRDAATPKAVLLLGIHPQQLGISAMFRLFTPNKFDDRIWVASPSLAELELQPDAKKQLWVNGLKPVFVDKSTGIF
jgi:hypothetical protein